MGVNLFVEGNPAPIVVRLQLPRPVRSLEELSEVSLGLREIEALRRVEWAKVWGSYRFRQKRGTHVIRFSVTSPPYAEILTDPAWLAVLLTVLTNYDRIGSNLKKVQKDLEKLLGAVRGLTARQLQLLEIAVRLTGERWAEKGEHHALLLARRFRRIRLRLIGDSEAGPSPDIEIIDIANKNEPW